MAMSGIRISLSGTSPQKVEEALHGGHLNSTVLAQLGYQIQVSRDVFISTNQVGRSSPNRRLQDDVIVWVAAEPEVTPDRRQADDGAYTRHECLNIILGDLPYLHESGAQQNLVQFVEQWQRTDDQKTAASASLDQASGESRGIQER